MSAPFTAPPADYFHAFEFDSAYDFRVREALRGLDAIAAHRMALVDTGLDHDALAALAAALQRLRHRGILGALYSVRLVVAASWSDAQSAMGIVTPTVPAVSPRARVYWGLAALDPDTPAKRMEAGAEGLELCAFAHITGPSVEAMTAGRARTLCCEWLNLFRTTPMVVGSRPFFFTAGSTDRGGAPRFGLFHRADEASPYDNRRANDDLDDGAFAPEQGAPIAAPRDVRGCVWGVVINPACASSSLAQDGTPLRWPMEMCVCSDLCNRVLVDAPEDASVTLHQHEDPVFEPPYFAFVAMI
jgi:hypothetical protein